MKMTIFRSRTWAAAAVLLAATTVFASCEKDDSPGEETGENTFTLTGGPGVGSMVYVTDYPLSGDTEYQDVADDHIAYGVIEAGNACEFAYWEGANTGTFNVLVRSSGETRAESGDVFKYKNGVQFTDGVASLDWSGMTTIVAGVGEGYADILTFTFEGIVGEAVIDPDELTVTATADETVNLDWIMPTYTLSEGATAQMDGFDLTSGADAIDFTEMQVFTVTSSDGTLINLWKITITKEDAGDEEWSLPENLKVTVQWINNGETRTNVATKIGETYHAIHQPGTYETLMSYLGDDRWSWWYRAEADNEWSYGDPFHFYNSREEVNSRLGGPDFVYYLIPDFFYINLCPVTGKDIILGRDVTVREGSVGKYWMDDEYNVCLKAELNENMFVVHIFEVTEWDEDVDGFPEGFEIPEEEE